MQSLLMIGHALAGPPDPKPEPVPGMDKITTLLNWLAWGVAMVAFAVFLAALGKIAMDALGGRETQGVKVAVIALIVSIAAGSAGTIMSAVA